jgi:hypothetical protein
MLRGSLFTREYLLEGIKDSEAWKALDQAAVDAARAEIEKHLATIRKLKKPNEAETESELIWPALAALGWNHSLPQQNLSVGGREKVPDGLLFADGDAKDKAAAETSWSRFRHGLCIMEAKRWERLLDRGDKSDADDPGIPSNQIINYVRRVDDVTRGKLRWGILTNGRQWRLYFAGADSISEEHLEIDLGGVFHLPGYQGSLFADDLRFTPDHVFRLFILLFGRDAFLPTHQGKTLHALVRDQGKHWEAGVAANLSRIVFEDLYPKLVRAIAVHDPGRDDRLPDDYLGEVRQGALIFLYRLLFVLYAEDRKLLPVERDEYKEFALTKLRDEIARKFSDRSDFSDRATLYWARLDSIFIAIGTGDDTLGIPPYNGGLFDPSEAPILVRCKLPDKVLAEIIFPLSHIPGERPKYINYRDLSVQQLGSIYERLLEFDLVADDDEIAIRLNPFARKGSGSYYTPEPLVKLIIERVVGPLIIERVEAFRRKADDLGKSRRPIEQRLDELAQLDPATSILELKICDPAMGSGHFLVSLVDWMADRVLAAIDDATEAADWGGKRPYESPLIKRVETIRTRIQKRAKEHGWPLPERQLDERHIIRRMILKRCVYGVDLNPMAVELAKVSLWLHTFTVGAPLSFLDHHLRCGDSLFGEHVRGALDWLAQRGNIMATHVVAKAKGVVAGMQKVEALTDADIAEVKESERNFEDVESGVRPITALLDFIHALRWQDPKDQKIKTLANRFFDGQFGDVWLVLGGDRSSNEEFARFYDDCRTLVAERRFLHWEVAFPGVWTNWESAEPHGGFDAVIGNPPWDRLKFQEVEWFAARKPEIAKAQRAADRKRTVAKLKKDGDPLALAHEKAVATAETQARLARSIGDYPLLSGGDTNIYSLFVERGTHLINAEGLVGLLTPSGIASDKTASEFFKSIATTGRLAALIDFENRRPNDDPFFPDVDSRFKFCAFVVGGKRRKFDGAQCAFFLNDTGQLEDESRTFILTAEDFARVNPNTGTAPIFRTRRDAEITIDIYKRLPVLVDYSAKKAMPAYPVKYVRMFDMTNDSNLFITRAELEKTAYPIDGNRWKRGDHEFVPLYEGKMVQAYDHRAASVVVNPENLNRPAQPQPATDTQHEDPNWLPEPQFWVTSASVDWTKGVDWGLVFKDVTSPTNVRTMIAAFIRRSGVGNTLPLLVEDTSSYAHWAPFILANFNSIPFDFTARQKVQGQHLNWFIVEQLPVVPREAYARRFGDRSAADIVRNDVVALTYTANDMTPFARDMGYDGPPFKWNEADRARRRARLDALYFMLYFPSATAKDIAALRDTATYIFSTFPIVAREDIAAHGRYLSRDLCLAYINALAAGDPDATIAL